MRYVFCEKWLRTLRRAHIFVTFDSANAFEAVGFGAGTFAYSHILGEFVADEALILFHILAVSDVLFGSEVELRHNLQILYCFKTIKGSP